MRVLAEKCVGYGGKLIFFFGFGRKYVFTVLAKNWNFYGLGWKVCFCGFSRKYVFVVSAENCFLRFQQKMCFAVSAEKCIFMVLVRNCVFAVLMRKCVIYNFDPKMRFYVLIENYSLRFGGKVNFYGFGWKVFVYGFGENMCFCCSAQKCVFTGFYWKVRFRVLIENCGFTVLREFFFHKIWF